MIIFIQKKNCVKFLIRSFFIFFFVFGYSQNNNFIISYELGEGVFNSSKDDILTQYIVKDSKGEIIGYIRQDDEYENQFNYYDINNKNIGFESNISNDPFENNNQDKFTINVYGPSNNTLYKKRWDNNLSEKFDILIEEKVIAKALRNENNQWEVFKMNSSFNTVYADMFTKKVSNNLKQEKSKKTYTSKIKPKKNKKPLDHPTGFGIYLSQDAADKAGGVNSKIRLGVEINGINLGINNSLGFTVGYGESNTLVTDEYALTDYDVAVTYGLSIFPLLKVKAGLGCYSLNYDFMESFGPFYDIEYGVYYSAGLQYYIPLGNQGITLDAYTNNYGLSYGIGFKF